MLKHYSRKEPMEREPAVKDTVERWPALFMESQVSKYSDSGRVHSYLAKTYKPNYFKNWTVDISEPKGEILALNLRRFCNRISTFNIENNKSDIIGRRTAVLYGLPLLLGEDPTDFYKTCIECQAGLNFADEEEARQFYLAVQKQISDNKAHSMLSRSYSVGSVTGWKEKIEKCLGDSKVFKRQPSPVRGSGHSHNVDSPTRPPESNPAVSRTMSSQVFGSPQTHFSTEEESIFFSLAKRKGPLPPLPPHARADMKLHQSGSVQTSDSPIHMLSWVPPPPAYTAPNAPLSSAVLKKSASFAPVKDSSLTVVKRFQGFHVNADMQGESGYGNQ